LCTFRKQKMTVLADSKVSDVKVTWWFWNKRVGLCTYMGVVVGMRRIPVSEKYRGI